MIRDIMAISMAQKNGYKVGIIGSIGDTLKSSILKSCVENYDFTNQIEAINSEAAKLKNVDNCHVVVLTAHDDIDNLTGKGITNVDAVFGGHAHVVKKGVKCGKNRKTEICGKARLRAHGSARSPRHQAPSA